MFTDEELEHINSRLEGLPAEKIIEWALITLPGLYQTTAFGLSGLVILDIISKLDVAPVDLVFIDTLHHFDETLELVDRVKEKYPKVALHVYYPDGARTREEFAEKYGESLWETNDLFYDYLVKSEPASNAYKELGVKAVFTGRRRSQGAARSSLEIVEKTEEGILKVNPLARWSFDQVNKYIKDNNVPYNVLLDRGYRSVGDYHSTVPVGEGEDERAGRWKGKAKTECGIHDTGRFKELRSAKLSS